MVQFPGALFGPSRMPGENINAPIVFFDDFIAAYTGVDLALANESDPTGTFSATADRGEWLYTALAGGTDPTVQDNADGGWLLFKTDGDAGDHAQIQLNGESFLMAKGRRMLWQSRLKWTNTTGDSFVGLSTATTDVYETKPADGIFGFHLTADADLEYWADVTGGSAPAAVNTGYDITADTWVVLSFEYDGSETIRMYADAAEIARTTTNVPIGEYMSPIFNVQSNGAEETITIDYVLVVNDRA